MLKRLGKYDLIELVGHGAMGEVYKAHDPSIGRLVALKTITGSLVGNEELLDRFYQEARSSGTLQHPNIITIYELGHEGASPFIAMEFLEGESLEKIIDRRAVLPLSQKVGFVVPVCRALDYAHKRGVVHRDIKPGNVMLTKDGNVKVVDFGIARLVDASKTQTNIMIGTLGYMSPQQFRGERADRRSDIWALGVLFYELLCYKRPFEGHDSPSLMMAIVDEKNQPTPIRDLAPNCPPELEVLIGKMLQKNANLRFQSMEEVLIEIEPIWRSLQEQSASGLIAEGEVLMQAHDFVHARELIYKALQIDSRNERAKTLLELINAEMKRMLVESQVQGAIEKAQALLAEGRHLEARAELEAALELDSGFAPAQELLSEVKRVGERARQIENGLRIARQLLAEGAFLQATQEVQKILDLEPANSPAHALHRQILEQQSRRDERKRHADILQRARQFWAEQRLDECVELLVASQKDFPGDPEIAKLLHRAHQDQAEHQKQQKLAQARNMLAASRLDDAAAIVESLSSQQPDDSAIRKMSGLVLEEKEEIRRKQKLQAELAQLQSLVNAERFSDAVARGERLLREFPGDPALADIVNFSRGELSRIEQKRILDEALISIRNKIQAKKFGDAFGSAGKALSRFPHHPELEALQEHAHSALKEKENRQLVQKRISEIRRMINGGQQTDAVDLARETLANLGPDTQITQMLRTAEMEHAQKQDRKQLQEKHLAAAQDLIQVGRFDDATQILLGALETRVLSKKDPRVRRILTHLERKKPSPPAATPPVPVRSDVPLTGDGPAKDYVFQQRAPLPENVVSPPDLSSSEPASAASSQKNMSGPTSQLDSPPSAELQDVFVIPLTPPKTQKQTRSAATALRTHPFVQVAELQFRIFIGTIRARTVFFALVALVLFAVVLLVSRFLVRRAIQEESAILNHAQQLEQQKKWPEALAAYETLAGRHGTFAKQGRVRAASLQSSLNAEAALIAKAQSADAAGHFSDAANFYQQVANLHGDEEQRALDAVERLRAIVKPTGISPPDVGPRNGTHVSYPAYNNAPKSQSGKCSLVSSDIPAQLDRAEKDAGMGNYADAERQYKAVLACDASNERARIGLAKLKIVQKYTNPSPVE